RGRALVKQPDLCDATWSDTITTWTGLITGQTAPRKQQNLPQPTCLGRAALAEQNAAAVRINEQRTCVRLRWNLQVRLSKIPMWIRRVTAGQWGMDRPALTSREPR